MPIPDPGRATPRGRWSRGSGHSQTTLSRGMPQGDPLSVDYDGLTDRHISLESTMRVKATKRPGRPKKRNAERVRNRPVNDELGCPV